MKNEVLEHRRAVQMNILKSFGVDVSEDNLEKGIGDEVNLFEMEAYKSELTKAELDAFEKANHNVGDIHPNGKWIWTEYKPGKFNWRVINGRLNKKNSANKDEEEKKNIEEHAKKTSTEILKKVANSSNAPSDLKNSAKKELEKREGKDEIEEMIESTNKKQTTSSSSTTKINKKTDSSSKSEESTIDEVYAEAAKDKVLKQALLDHVQDVFDSGDFKDFVVRITWDVMWGVTGKILGNKRSDWMSKNDAGNDNKNTTQYKRALRKYFPEVWNKIQRLINEK